LEFFAAEKNETLYVRIHKIEATKTSIIGLDADDARRTSCLPIGVAYAGKGSSGSLRGW
jgi:hypothetical protein